MTLASAGEPTEAANRFLHETLVLCCAEALKDSGEGFGSLFAQVDYLCKRHGISRHDQQAIQDMRRHSNQRERLSHRDLLYDVRALALLISAAFGTGIPDALVRLIPTENRPQERGGHIDYRYIRCVVNRWDDHLIYADADFGETAIDYRCNDHGVELGYLQRMVRKGMQLNLLDCRTGDNGVILPSLVIVEPDFLVDISSIAACFTDYGHPPLLYTANRLRQRGKTQAMLLGNFAGRVLDDLISGSTPEEMGNTLNRAFREQALEYCSCDDFHAETFLSDARQQVKNLAEVVQVLFAEYQREHAVLEPSFISERLGLQGRVDLMTTDLRLLVEQKSGQKYGNRYREDHYVQLLLYYGVLRYNFGISERQTDIRLLYSRYPAKEGLLVVNFYQQLFREAIKFRNQLVATEYHIARQGFGSIVAHLNPASLFGEVKRDNYFNRYIEPPVTLLSRQLSGLSRVERSYLERMLTFVYREQLYSKVGSQEGKSSSVADLWNMPLLMKRETGNIYTDLTITDRQKTPDSNGYNLLTLQVPSQGDGFLPNFRRGDMVCLYEQAARPADNICSHLLYKGTLQELSVGQLVVRLNDGQQNPEIFRTGGLYTLEHGYSDVSTNSSIRGLFSFITGPADKRQLLLGVRPPQADSSLALSRSYHPNYDEVLLRAKQARDYFLLVGPPGTGKTSMALRYMVTEHRGDLLLLSYTNRAVDEICQMLSEAGFDYIRLGNESSCDHRFRSQLLGNRLGVHPKLDQIRRLIQQTRIIVGTTSMLQSHPDIFHLKHFPLAIVDEASQILEPDIVGLLSRVDKFILIGDHKQLPAVVQQSPSESVVTDETLLQIALTDCAHSLFERLLRWELSCGRQQFIGILRRQGRMHPDIAAFPNQMFYVREHLEPVPLPHQCDQSLGYDLPAEDALDELLKHHRMIFIPAEPLKSVAIPTSDKVNEAEARIVADLLCRIRRFYGDRFDATKTVGVIVPYRNQIGMIRREIERLQMGDLFSDVSIDTVERYQGSQRDVIIYSFTVSQPYQLDFLTASCFEEEGHTIDRKLNVAITRARKQLLLTGSERLLRRNAIFAELIDFCEKLH